MSATPPAVVGTGFAVPEQVRTNDDPIFDWLREHAPGGPALFTGYVERRVLGPGETVTWLMVEAAQAALQAAGAGPENVDLLLGYGSVAEYISPNTLAQVHAELGLPASVPALPFADDFTNFNSALVAADALIRAGSVQTALIVCGDNWTRYVDYRTPQSISAGDGAGAAVVAPATSSAQFSLVDREHVTASHDYGAMFMAADAAGASWTAPYIHITPQGFKDFVSFGIGEAPKLVSSLMERNGLQPSDVTLICHQASGTLIASWQQTLGAITILDTLAQYANVVLAAIPVTLAARSKEIATDHLILLGLGVQLQASALLLARQPSAASAAATSSTLAAAPHVA
jgi:3-oxoacyl-[acyl-carrier-protein] synthase III